MMNEKLLFLMLIGIPGSGKSFYVNKTLPVIYPNLDFFVFSTDDYIDKLATENGSTYSELFESKYNEANAAMNAGLAEAIANNRNIIWDQTNTTVKSRAKKVARIPKNYHKIAVMFQIPTDEVLYARLASRPGKTIPMFVIKTMSNQLESPTLEEGFDDIRRISND